MIQAHRNNQIKISINRRTTCMVRSTVRYAIAYNRYNQLLNILSRSVCSKGISSASIILP